MKTITLYTDGACSYNPGPGGYGAILIFDGKEKVISGGDKNTTNNRMELMAAIEGLKAIKEPCEVDLYTDSAYVCNAFAQGWISNWIKNNWKGSGNKPVLNKELWEELISLTNIHKVNFHKVKGHADNVYNNRCDQIARAEVEAILSSGTNETYKSENKSYIGKKVFVEIDRPIGFKKEKYNMIYPVNYGFIPGTISGDGEELDAYVLGVFEPVKTFEGVVIAIIHRTNDDDDKLVVVPENKKYSDEQIRALTEFQERFFESVIIR